MFHRLLMGIRHRLRSRAAKMEIVGFAYAEALRCIRDNNPKYEGRATIHQGRCVKFSVARRVPLGFPSAVAWAEMRPWATPRDIREAYEETCWIADKELHEALVRAGALDRLERLYDRL